MKKNKLILIQGFSGAGLDNYDEDRVLLLYNAIISTVNFDLNYDSIFDYPFPNDYRVSIAHPSFVKHLNNSILLPGSDSYLEKYCSDLLGLDVSNYVEDDFCEVLRRLYLLDFDKSSFEQLALLFKDKNNNKTTVLKQDPKRYKEGDEKKHSYFDYSFASLNNGIPTQKEYTTLLTGDALNLANALHKTKTFITKKEKSQKSLFYIKNNKFFAQVFVLDSLWFRYGDLNTFLNDVTDSIDFRERYYSINGEIGVASGFTIRNNNPTKGLAGYGYVDAQFLSPSEEVEVGLPPITAPVPQFSDGFSNVAIHENTRISLKDFFNIHGFSPNRYVTRDWNTGQIKVYKSDFTFEYDLFEPSAFNLLNAYEVNLNHETLGDFTINAFGRFGVYLLVGATNTLFEFDTFKQMYEFQKIYNKSFVQYLIEKNNKFSEIADGYYYVSSW